MKAIPYQGKARFYFRLFLILIVLIALGVGVQHWIRGEMGLVAELLEMARNQWGGGVLIVGGMVYMLLLSLPFVPGVELGLLLMCIFGKEGIVFIYLFTVVGLNLAFVTGRWLPRNWIVFLFEKLGFSRSCAGHSDEIEEMLNRSNFGHKFHRHWLGSYILKYRYLTLAVLFNLPGNYLLGGGGGISLICGASRHIPLKRFLFTAALATSPVPLLAYFGLVQIETFFA